MGTKQDGIALLYGRDPVRDHIKSVLTSDNVLQKGEIYDYNNPWSTTKGDDFSHHGVTQRPQKSELKQDTLKSNINFGSYTDTRNTSIQKADYDTKSVAKTESFKPLNNINIVDLDPAYLAQPVGKRSTYSDEFDKDALALHQSANKIVLHGRGNPITNYLRATHFTLGSDETSKESEAQARFKGTTSDSPVVAVAAHRAQQDKRNNHVFREGDYNMTPQPEPVSIFSSSYKSAGVPSTQKGYDHVVHAVNVKGNLLKSEMAKNLYVYLRDRFQNPRDPTQVNLRQAFAHFDKKRTGYITYESLAKVIQRLQPIESSELHTLLGEFDLNKDGKIDYLEFETFLNNQVPPVDKEDSLYQNTYTPSVFEGANRQRSNPDEVVDGQYQIGTHFKLGATDENACSLYKSSFIPTKETVRKPDFSKPPPPSQMLPVEPEHMPTQSSIQQQDYTHYTNLQALATERVLTLKANKSLHENVSFAVAPDTSRDKELQLKSMTGCSYPPQALPKPVTEKGFQAKWNHLKTEDALPEHTSGAHVSEHTASYNNAIADVAQREFSSNKQLRQSRVRDEKMSHLSLGNEAPKLCSEQHAKFSVPSVNHDAPAAGIKGGPIAEHQHIHHSDETTSLSDPSVKSLQDSIKQTILEKYYNPRDPLNINLRKAFMEFDRTSTGKITVTGLKEACKRFQLPVDDTTLHRYFVCLDKNGDGSIDYNEFADELGIHITNVTNKGMATVMKSDYTPINERSGFETALQKAKPPTIETSHYFHLNHDKEKQMSATQKDFAHPIDQIDWYRTITSKQ